MKSAGKARNNGLYRHIRTSKEIIRNLLNDYRNYTDWYYCYDSMLSGSDAHISNRHCRLFFIVTVSLLVHCWRR